MMFLYYCYIICPGIIYTIEIPREPDNDNAYCRDKNYQTLCCAGFHKVKGKCIECENGTVSEQGGNCTLCQEDFYGSMCATKCKCEPEQRCDNVEGCVDNQITTEENRPDSSDRENNEDGNAYQTKLMTYLSVSVALLSFLIAMIIAISKGFKTYIEKKTSAIKAISQKNKDESYQRKTNIYGTYNKKATLRSGETDDEYEFDTDNCSDEDQYSSIRESQLVTTILPHDNQYSTSNLYNTGSYTYNHITREGEVCTAGVLKARENYTQNFGKTFATFQDQ